MYIARVFAPRLASNCRVAILAILLMPNSYCPDLADAAPFPSKYAIHNMYQKSWKKLGYVPDSEDELNSNGSDCEAVSAQVESQNASQRELLTSHKKVTEDDLSELDQSRPDVRF